jgi:transcriptional regulator with XRE-family HTH domain
MNRVEALMRELTAAIREEVGALPTGVLTLAEEIAAARKRARMSLQDVADASGFTKSHVWELEQGRSRNPTIGMVAGLSKALGVPFLRLAEAALNSLSAGGMGRDPCPSQTVEAVPGMNP